MTGKEEVVCHQPTFPYRRPAGTPNGMEPSLMLFTRVLFLLRQNQMWTLMRTHNMWPSSHITMAHSLQVMHVLILYQLKRQRQLSRSFISQMKI